jgi:hypothetical protein
MLAALYLFGTSQTVLEHKMYDSGVLGDQFGGKKDGLNTYKPSSAEVGD